MSGDVETNPGPDLSESFNKPKNIADAIRAVKEEWLADDLSDVYSYIRIVFVSLLFLCGDVEQNPSPTIEQKFEQLLDGQKSGTSRLDAIEEKLKKVEASVLVVKEFGPKIATLEKTVQNLEKKLVELEDRRRRKNLIVYGVEEKTDESVESLTNEVVDHVFSTVLQVKRIHRLGRKQPNKQRPVILKLIDQREKTLVLKNCSKLKGTNISVSEDFAPATRQIRKQLWNSTAEIRKTGAKVQLVYDKIKIDKNVFEWDNVQMKRVPARAAVTNSQAQKVFPMP